MTNLEFVGKMNPQRLKSMDEEFREELEKQKKQFEDSVEDELRNRRVK